MADNLDRIAVALESVAASLLKLANPMMVAHPDLHVALPAEPLVRDYDQRRYEPGPGGKMIPKG
jgi:hypothetical protein